MSSNWEKFRKLAQESPTGETPRPVGRKLNGVYSCQVCRKPVKGATYFPTESVLRYVCTEDHESFVENFKLAF